MDLKDSENKCMQRLYIRKKKKLTTYEFKKSNINIKMHNSIGLYQFRLLGSEKYSQLQTKQCIWYIFSHKYPHIKENYVLGIEQQ